MYRQAFLLGVLGGLGGLGGPIRIEPQKGAGANLFSEARAGIWIRPRRSVSRILYPALYLTVQSRRRSFLCDARRRAPETQCVHCAMRPTRGVLVVPGRNSPLIWPCCRWGLPCRLSHPRRGALLPHHFTLTGIVVAENPGGIFLLHFPSAWAKSNRTKSPNLLRLLRLDVIKHRALGLKSPAVRTFLTFVLRVRLSTKRLTQKRDRRDRRGKYQLYIEISDFALPIAGGGSV
jgi:hypothetical protein